MATKERLLAHLLSAPNQWFSGQSLADQLGVSRESVWKAIRSLNRPATKLIRTANGVIVTGDC